MCDEVEFPRALQNHLLQERHLTTQPGEWMPQYLGSMLDVQSYALGL